MLENTLKQVLQGKRELRLFYVEKRGWRGEFIALCKHLTGGCNEESAGLL